MYLPFVVVCCVNERDPEDGYLSMVGVASSWERETICPVLTEVFPLYFLLQPIGNE